MDFLKKLDYLMLENNLNKHSLSKACDIPYTTIDGWYKKGYEGLKLSTLRKLSDYFGTTLDFWTDNNDVSHRNKKSPEPVAPDSREIEEVYKLLKKTMSELHIDVSNLTERQKVVMELIADLIADNF